MDWRKSSYSGSSGSCVETASGEGVVMVRDTTDRDGSRRAGLSRVASRRRAAVSG